MSQPFRVYWQPACTSCLRTREFLTARQIPFESINVREQSGAMEELARLGARSVPVVAQGNRFVFAQALEDVARFVGVSLETRRLPPAELVKRLDLVLIAGQRYLRQLPADQLGSTIPGRKRSYLDLAYHMFVIPTAFLDAARGGELTQDYFERKPPPDSTPAEVDAFAATVRHSVAQWWQESGEELPATVDTYYGVQPTHGVLERTCWHSAQHCRQLMTILGSLGLTPDGALGPAELEGLPLPDEVWDSEVPF